MSGWIRCESDGWARARVALREAGISLPRDLAILDLRHLDDRGDIPSRPRLAERWGWTDKRVRLLLASEAEWRDPLRSGEPKGPTKGRRRADEGPTKGRPAPVETPPIEETGPTRGRRGADEGPTKGHTRGEAPSPSPSPTPLAGVLRTLVEVEPSTPPSSAPAVATVWAAYQAHHPRRKLGDPERVAIKARLQGATVDDLTLVVDWAHRAPHERAQYLRANNHLGITSLLQARTWGDRLEWAQDWADRGRPLEVEHPTRAGPGPRQERRSELDIWQEIRSEQGWTSGN